MPEYLLPIVGGELCEAIFDCDRGGSAPQG